MFIGVEIPYLSYSHRLVEEEVDGTINYAKFIERFRIEMRPEDSGWQDTKTLKNSKLPTCVSKGYLLSQAKGITRIFTDYIETKDKPTFDNIGNTTIIPTSVIVSIKKINL